jgi:hypothetical protein
MKKRHAMGAQLLVNASEFGAFSSALAENIHQFDELT